MKLLGPPRPWHEIDAIGTLVLWNGVPRAIKGVNPTLTSRVLVFLEGLGYPLVVNPTDMVQVVELDETDAMLTMLSAGLTVEYLKETS